MGTYNDEFIKKVIAVLAVGRTRLRNLKVFHNLLILKRIRSILQMIFFI